MHISLPHHSIDHLRQELEKLFLHVPLPLKLLLVQLSVCLCHVCEVP